MRCESSDEILIAPICYPLWVALAYIMSPCGCVELPVEDCMRRNELKRYIVN